MTYDAFGGTLNLVLSIYLSLTDLVIVTVHSWNLWHVDIMVFDSVEARKHQRWWYCWRKCEVDTCLSVGHYPTLAGLNILLLSAVILWFYYCQIEMGRSSADAEVRPNDSAECSARFGSATCDYSAELRQTFGVICSFAFAAFCARRWR